MKSKMLRKIIFIRAITMNEIEAIVLGRWEKMNVPIHCLGFALSP